MPYDVSKPPAKLRNLSSKKKRQWIHVFNSCWERHHDDARCHRMAWGVVGKENCDDCSGEVPLDMVSDAAILSLEDFCGTVTKMAPVSIPGVKRTMAPQKPGAGEQWHEIESEPGYLVRYVGQGKDRKMVKKPKASVKPAAGKMAKHEGFPSTDMVSGLTIESGTGNFIATVKFRGKTQKFRIKPQDLRKLPEEWRRLIHPTSYREAKMDPETGEMVATTDVKGKKIGLRLKPDDASKLPSVWQRRLIQIASSRDAANLLKNTEALKELLSFSRKISSGDLLKVGARKTSKKETIGAEAKIDITTPGGARAMALALTRIFGGWNGGCRLSPSANRIDTYHISVFCETPQELGQRILDLKSYLLSEGYAEESEGIFRHDSRAVFLGRSYPRKKGKRPLVFMITVRTK
jgi:hypothetical protein